MPVHVSMVDGEDVKFNRHHHVETDPHNNLLIRYHSDSYGFPDVKIAAGQWRIVVVTKVDERSEGN